MHAQSCDESEGIGTWNGAGRLTRIWRRDRTAGVGRRYEAKAFAAGGKEKEKEMVSKERITGPWRVRDGLQELACTKTLGPGEQGL